MDGVQDGTGMRVDFVRRDHPKCPRVLMKRGREKRLQVQICFKNFTKEENKQTKKLRRDT